ncbi:MAG: amidohydrolase [Chloroflexota bacterium]
MSAAPDRVILGRVATLDGATGWGWAGGIAIRDGRVVAAGDEATIAALAGPGTTTWRLGPDRVVLPGIVDAHLHLTGAALAAQQLDLSGITGRVATLRAIGEAHERLRAAGDRGEGWLLGHGWSVDRMAGWPTAADLEAIAPGRPIALWAHDHHGRWVSPRALRAAGIGPDTPDPTGGRIGRGPGGAPDGRLVETAASLVDRAIPEAGPGEVARALEAYAHQLARLGVVGVHDPGALVPDPALRGGPILYRRLAETGALPLRVVACVRGEQVPAAIAAGFRTGGAVHAEAGAAATPAARRVAERYRDGWLKLFSDGALGSRSAALLAPYEADDPAGAPPAGPRGLLLQDPERLAATARRAADAGIAVQIHAIGDAAVRLVLDVLGDLPRVGAAHHRVEHAQLVDPADIARFAALGVVASVQPCHLLSDAVAARGAWGERSANAFPLAALAAAGAQLAFGTDAPVEPPDPWPGIAAAVTRAGGAWPANQAAFHPEQAIPLVGAIRAATLAPPRSLGVTDEGHLAPSARADLIVVAAAAIDEPPRPGGALEACRPFATLIDGEPAWQDPAFDP